MRPASSARTYGPPSGPAAGYNGGSVHSAAVQPISPERFEQLVAEALDDVPDELWASFDNVAVIVEDEHPDEPDLLGLYEGVPLTERGDVGGMLPDRIAIYRIPLCLLVADEDDLVEEVYVTVVHELAHHLGIDDAELHRLGWA